MPAPMTISEPGSPGDPEVVIVGGGPTGLWLACELALAGVRVTALERLAKPTGLSKALGLQSRSVEMLDHRGIANRFTDGRTAPPFLNFAMFPLDLRKIDFPHPYAVLIPQSDVEALLAERAVELGAEIRRGHALTELRQSADGVSAEVLSESGSYEIRCEYLVGCDGGHSVVRHQLGASFAGLEPTVVGRMGDVQLSPASLDLLKKGVPELGGHEFGIARTDYGNFAIVPMGGDIFRVAAIEWDQGPVDRDAPMEMEELRAAIQRVTGLDLPMGSPVWLSRLTDSSRLVDQYRHGRILLAGDAAHVHWPYGGKGMQTGLQDAGNLGWKLAAQIHGWAPPALLDSYHSERHPVGQRLMTFTRAQEALARPGAHVTALRELFANLLAQEQMFRTIVEETSDVDMCYELGAETEPRDPLLGRWAPNLSLQLGGETVLTSDLMKQGGGVLIDLANDPATRETAGPWADRVKFVSASSSDALEDLEALLIRPDGYVAWVRRSCSALDKAAQSLHASLETWFGRPAGLGG